MKIFWKFHGGEGIFVECHNCGELVKLDDLKKITLEDLLLSLPFCSDKCVDEFREQGFHVNAFNLESGRRATRELGEN